MTQTERAGFVERNECVSCGSRKLLELSSGGFDEGALQRFIAEDPWGEHPAPFLAGRRWSYVTCEECGMAFHRFVLNADWNDRRFSKWMSHEAIQAFEQRLNTPTYKLEKATAYTAHVLQIEKLTRSLRGTSPTRLLDFGCGYGGFLSMCSMYGFEAYGVDRSPARLGNNTYEKVFAEIDEVTGLAPFHALTLFEVLEHLDDPHDHLYQLGGLLAKGGVLVLETPDCSGVRDITTRDDYNKIHPLEHINGFTPESLRRFATRLGFLPITRQIACVTCDSMKIAKTVVKRLIRHGWISSTQMYFLKV